jgi:hypothetical protein
MSYAREHLLDKSLVRVADYSTYSAHNLSGAERAYVAARKRTRDSTLSSSKRYYHIRRRRAFELWALLQSSLPDDSIEGRGLIR